MGATADGAFDELYAGKKRWKLDAGLWRAIQAVLPPPPLNILDLGAGLGSYVMELRRLGYNARGLDGIPNVGSLTRGYVLECNLAQPAFWQSAADWSLSFEVGEHIPAARAFHYIDNVAHSAVRGIMTSWAVPGQRGRNHINCQPVEWVAEQYASRGWVVDAAATSLARVKGGKGWKKKLLVFQPARGS